MKEFSSEAKKAGLQEPPAVPDAMTRGTEAVPHIL